MAKTFAFVRRRSVSSKFKTWKLTIGNHPARRNILCAKHEMFRAIQALTVILVSSESGLAAWTPTSSWPTARAS